MNIPEFKNNKLKDYDGVFEMVGNKVVGENFKKTNIRSRNIRDFEFYINIFEENGYESDDAIFTGLFKNQILQFLIWLIVQVLEKAQILIKILLKFLLTIVLNLVQNNVYYKASFF